MRVQKNKSVDGMISNDIGRCNHLGRWEAAQKQLPPHHIKGGLFLYSLFWGLAR